MRTMINVIAPFLVIGTIYSCQKEVQASPMVAAQSNNQATVSSMSTFKSIGITSSAGAISDDYLDLQVEISKIEAQLDNGFWFTVSDQNQTVSIRQIENGQFSVLAALSQPEAQQITDLRLTFGSHNYLFGLGVTGETLSELMFSGSNVLTLHIDRNQLQTNAEGVLLVNMDLQQSLVIENGEVVFKPTLDILEDASTGIKGKVEGITQAMVLIESNNHTYRAWLSSTGEFIVRDMAEGAYTIFIEPESGSDSQFGGKTITGVIVTEGKMTITEEIDFS